MNEFYEPEFYDGKFYDRKFIMNFLRNFFNFSTIFSIKLIAELIALLFLVMQMFINNQIP